MIENLIEIERLFLEETQTRKHNKVLRKREYRNGSNNIQIT